MLEPILITPNIPENLKITFNYRKNENFTFEFNKKMTVREMLNNFLDKTNSVKTLDLKKLMFFHGTILLNSPKFIDKSIENIFGRGKIIIQIKDRGNYIGG